MKNQFHIMSFLELASFVTSSNDNIKTPKDIQDIIISKPFSSANIGQKEAMLARICDKVKKSDRIDIEYELYKFIRNNEILLRTFIAELPRAGLIMASQVNDLYEVAEWINKKICTIEDYLKIKEFKESDEPRKIAKMGGVEALYQAIGLRNDYYNLFVKLPKSFEFLRLNQLFVKIHPVTLLEEYSKTNLTLDMQNPPSELLSIRLGIPYEIKISALDKFFQVNSKSYESAKVLEKFSKLFWTNVRKQYETSKTCQGNLQIPAFIMMDTSYYHISKTDSSVGGNFQASNVSYRVALEFIRDCPVEYIHLIITEQKNTKIQLLFLKTRLLFLQLSKGTVIGSDCEDIFAKLSKNEINMFYNFITENGNFMKIFNEYLAKTKPEIAKKTVQYIFDNLDVTLLKLNYKSFLFDLVTKKQIEESDFEYIKSSIRENLVYAYIEERSTHSLYDFFGSIDCKPLQNFIAEFNPIPVSLEVKAPKVIPKINAKLGTIKPFSKLVPEDGLGENWRAEEQSELECNEAPSTSISSQIASGIEFRKRPIVYNV